MAANAIEFKMDQREFRESLKEIQRMESSIDPEWMKSTLRRRARPIENSMRRNAEGYLKSTRIAKMIGITAAKSRTGDWGAKVGVVKNDPVLFPDFSAPALASVLEYGTDERYRTLKKGVVVTGRKSTGRAPAMPFLRPAWDENVNQFMNKVQESIERKVLKEK
ncbi:MAG: hypothetical protein CL666_14735 [Balneola sp.]|nr:hypothetical protein [Balneola sp.]|tara:strand:+ start:10673 stop:11164 length:492 start_codon:yes stop_codon:yes gene_type:complete